MQKNILICAVTFSVTLATFMLASMGVQAALSDDLVFHGDIAALSVISQKPSSVQQRSSFQMPEGRLGGSWVFAPDSRLVAEVQYAKARDAVDGRYNVQVESVFFEFQKLFWETNWLQYGLIAHPWEDLSEKFWGYRFLGSRGPTLGFRNGYLSRSDLGVLIGDQFAPWASWSLMVVNGEGTGSDEQGPRKDFHLVVQAMPFAGFRGEQKITLALLVVQGAYDNIDAEVSEKERISVLLGFEQDRGMMGSLELMSAKDPVDGMNLLLADRVDLTAQGGQAARGAGGSLILKYRFLKCCLLDEKAGSFYELFGRVDQWNPATGVSAKGLRSQLLGIGFFPRQHLQISLAWSEVLYENNHAASVRDAADILLAARLKW